MGVVSQLSDFGQRVVAELQLAAGRPEPRSVDKEMSTVRSRNVEKHFPDKKQMERYWEMYRNVPIIRNPIRSFASEVVAPGYYVDAENDELQEELEEWLEQCCIVDGEIDKDFRHLLKKATIQREVKGTALAEKVYDDEENFYGFKLMRPETVRAYTYPGQSLLLPPDADVEEDERLFGDTDIRRTTNGEVAAYTQLTSDIHEWSSSNDGFVAFTRDSVLKLTRDTDTGEVFGTSRVYSVEDRLESLIKKLDDNDKAIESVAHPSLVYQLGTDENPFEPEKVQAFAEAHEQEHYEPGLKQFLQGNIDINEVTGEVAEIKEYLDWDLNYIISDLPMPKYSLGAFESDVNQFVSRSQSARLERSLKDARQEIEDEWTPTLKEKAEELDYNPDDVNALVISEDPEELSMMPEDGDSLPENSEGDANTPSGNNSNEQHAGPDGSNQSRPPASTEPERDGGGDMA